MSWKKKLASGAFLFFTAILFSNFTQAGEKIAPRQLKTIDPFLEAVPAPQPEGQQVSYIQEQIASEYCGRGNHTLFLWSSAPYASDDPFSGPLVTDRPDFTEASSTVGQGTVQLEMGYTFTRDKEPGGEVAGHTYPETLFRIGMFADWFELRIAYTYAEEKTKNAPAGNGRVRGNDDLYLGVKLWLTEQQGILPEMAILPQMLVPSGSNAFTNDQILPGVNWLYSWELTENLSLAGSSQINRTRDDIGHYYSEFAQSVALGLGITDEVGVYIEYYGFFPTSAVAADVGAEHYMNGGIAYLFNDNVQFDIRVGNGLNRRAADLFAGAGVSLRF